MANGIYRSPNVYVIAIVVFVIVAIIIGVIIYITQKKTHFDHMRVQEKMPIDFFGVKNKSVYERNVQEGQRYMRGKTMIIAGLARDSGDSIESMLDESVKIGSMCADYRIIIVENDSRDDTRNILLRRAQANSKIIILGCGINVPSCTLNMRKTVGHPIETWRIEKMVHLRNIYMDHVRQHFSNFDFLMIFDFDLSCKLWEEVFAQNFYHFKNDESIDAICCNGQCAGMIDKATGSTYYCDPYAHVDLDEDVYTMSSLDKADTDAWKQRYDERIKVSLDGKLVRVKSCFGECVIYRTAKVVDKVYSVVLDKYHELPICEHVKFNQDLNIYLNPAAVIMI